MVYLDNNHPSRYIGLVGKAHSIVALTVGWESKTRVL